VGDGNASRIITDSQVRGEGAGWPRSRRFPPRGGAVHFGRPLHGATSAHRPLPAALTPVRIASESEGAGPAAGTETVSAAAAPMRMEYPVHYTPPPPPNSLKRHRRRPSSSCRRSARCMGSIMSSTVQPSVSIRRKRDSCFRSARGGVGGVRGSLGGGGSEPGRGARGVQAWRTTRSAASYTHESDAQPGAHPRVAPATPAARTRIRYPFYAPRLLNAVRSDGSRVVPRRVTDPCLHPHGRLMPPFRCGSGGTRFPLHLACPSSLLNPTR